MSDPEKPPSTTPATPNDSGGVIHLDTAQTSVSQAGSAESHDEKTGFFSRIKNSIIKRKNGSETLREAIEEYIDELQEDESAPEIAQHERALISNVLKLRDTTVIDVMIPRADIEAVDVTTPENKLMDLLADKQFSRLPVYRDNLDNILGSIHIKDILSAIAAKRDIDLKSMIRQVPIVSPSLPILDLLLKMQRDKKHMVLVVDEYGGIDGLVTIGDVIESIVGEFDDEFDQEEGVQIITRPDGSVLADARVDIEDFEEEFGEILSEEEREEVDTLGGLVFFTASRIPARGEVIKHESGMVFEILEADQRRVSRLRIRNIPGS
ncbi:MAG: hemolysin family protein [Alphaproteobacteria bacterium]|nr:hemolysin family protein [Alphaproteobacteria bacterium]